MSIIGVRQADPGGQKNTVGGQKKQGEGSKKQGQGVKTVKNNTRNKLIQRKC
jgi:hypothetical protein